MRIAAVDIGSNSIHIIVAHVRPDLSFEVIDREKEMVRLGAGGLGGRPLTEAAMTAALGTLTRFKRLAEAHQVDEIVSAATSPVREAPNGGEFLRRVTQYTGLAPRVITGEEEARLIHQAVVYAVDATRSVMLRGWGAGGIWVDIVALFGFAVAFLSLAVWSLQRGKG